MYYRTIGYVDFSFWHTYCFVADLWNSFAQSGKVLGYTEAQQQFTKRARKLAC